MARITGLHKSRRRCLYRIARKHHGQDSTGNPYLLKSHLALNGGHHKKATAQPLKPKTRDSPGSLDIFISYPPNVIQTIRERFEDVVQHITPGRTYRCARKMRKMAIIFNTCAKCKKPVCSYKITVIRSVLCLKQKNNRPNAIRAGKHALGIIFEPRS